MADSDALRVRRSRAHKAGDHSLCKRCVVLRAPAETVAEAIPVTDPSSALRVLGGQLVAAYHRDPGNALLARELRMTLQALMAANQSVDDELEDLFADLRT